MDKYYIGLELSANDIMHFLDDDEKAAFIADAFESCYRPEKVLEEIGKDEILDLIGPEYLVSYLRSFGYDIQPPLPRNVKKTTLKEYMTENFSESCLSVDKQEDTPHAGGYATALIFYTKPNSGGEQWHIEFSGMSIEACLQRAREEARQRNVTRVRVVSYPEHGDDHWKRYRVAWFIYRPDGTFVKEFEFDNDRNGTEAD